MELKFKALKFLISHVLIFAFFTWPTFVKGSSSLQNDFNLVSNVIENKQGNTEFRLPLSVRPVNYKLEIMPILDPLDGFQTFTAPAKEWITVGCHEETYVVTLHAINLSVNAETISVVNLLDGSTAQVNSVSYTEEYNFLNIELSNPMQVGQQYEIFIEFITPISSDALNGMYLDFYDDQETGEIRYIATTLFAPYHTRSAFPCFDEPSFRATYDITIGHHTKYHAMSNTDIIETKPVEGIPDYQWDTFATTPSISSYIIAMIVSDLEFEQAPEGVFRNVSVRLYAKPQSIRQGAGVYSAKLSGDVMTYFESLFIVKYPISKLYSVALPQFFFNAMENWGLITYKEPVLLYLPGETSEEDRYKINYVLSHEKAHQHFGNIVACKWWAYVWLKEGFSTYFSHYGMNHTNPELNPWEQFVPTILQVAMEFDSTIETHPLENYPKTSEEVADIYTDIPYEKGASILRMASAMVTESVFMDGVRLYVDRFQYQSAEQNDVFQALQEAVEASPTISSLLPASVPEILDSWTTQAGYPLLKVSTIDSNTLEISQEKYIDGDISNPSDTWWVPIFLSPRPDTTLPENFPDAWIPSNVSSTTIRIDTTQAIIVDPGSIGYYRVLYDSSMLRRILKQLETGHLEIPAVARSKILNDYVNFALEGIVDVETSLELTAYLHQETDLVVWLGVLPFMDKLSRLLIKEEYYQDFKTYIGSKAEQALTLLEKTQNDNLEKGEKAILRSHLMKWAIFNENESSRQRQLETNSLFTKWMQNPESNKSRIPVNTQQAVYCSQVRDDADDNKIWSFLHSRYELNKNSGNFTPISKRFLKAMTCTRNSTLLQKLVEMISKDSTDIHDSDKSEVLQYLVENPIGKNLLMKRLNNANNLIKNLKTNKELRSILKILSSYNLNEIETETLKHLENYMSLSQRKILMSYIDQIHKNLKFIKDSSAAMGSWFKYQASLIKGN